MTDETSGVEAPRVPYANVNGQWPEGDLPELTEVEAIAATKRLLRFVKVKTNGKFKIGTGNRITWPQGGVYIVNAEKGWHELVHMVSHYAKRRLHPRAKPHGPQHAFIEKEMIRHVVEKGWLTGSLRRPEKPKPVRTEVDGKKLAKILDRIETWEAKQRRAINALRKLNRQKDYYLRKQAA